MNPSPEFGIARECFRHPIPELHYAADLLGRATDAFIADAHDLARDYLRQADIQAVYTYACSIMGRSQPRLDRPPQTEIAGAPQSPAAGPQRRVLSATIQSDVYHRDGWRCRFCGCRVISPQVRDVFRQAFPDIVRWRGANMETHAAFFALSATVSHVVPHARGGSHDAINLVTTCQPCNYGRGARLLEEVGLIDPRTRPPIIDGWDGLTRIMHHAKPASEAVGLINPMQPRPNQQDTIQMEPDPTANITPAAPSPPKRGRKMSPQQWFAELDWLQPGLSDRLRAFLDGCEKVQVQWRLDKVMVLNMRTRDTTLNVIGILPNGEVYIPWFIDREKEKFRRFAERLVQAIPDTIVYESPKQWIVRKAGKTPVSLLELLEVAGSVHTALDELFRAVNASSLSARPPYYTEMPLPPGHNPPAKPAPPGPTLLLPRP